MLGWALAATPEQDLARLGEVAPLRSARLDREVPAIPASAWREAIDGKVPTGLEAVEGHAAKKAWGIALLDQPIDRVWAAINDEQAQVEYTQLGYAELIAGKPCESGRRALQYLPLSLASDRWWITHRTANDDLIARTEGRVRELRWVSSSDPSEITSERGREIVASAVPVGFSRGSWFLVDMGEDRTLVEYAVWTDPGGSIPAGLMSMFASGSIRDTLEAMEAIARDRRGRCTLGR